jgi:hypothetical protein
VVPYAVPAAGTMVARTRRYALGAVVRAARLIGGIGTPLAFVLGPFTYLGNALGGRQNGTTTATLAFLVLHNVLAASVMRRRSRRTNG